MKAATKGHDRTAKHFHRRRQLLEHAVTHHRDAVAERHRLFLIVRDVDHRGPEPRGAAAPSSARVSTRSSGSRFDNGSSSRNACGSRTIARPSATRCRCPPDNCAGLRSSSASIRVMAAAGVTRPFDLRGVDGADPQSEREILAHGLVRIQRVALEHHRQIAAPAATSPSRREPPMSIRPAVGDSSPAISLSTVLLPLPDGPTRTSSSPSAIAIEQIAHGHLTVGKRLAHLFQRDGRHVSPSPRRPSSRRRSGAGRRARGRHRQVATTAAARIWPHGTWYCPRNSVMATGTV